MKKIIKLLSILVSIILLFTSCFKTEEEKAQESVDKVLTHLKKRYGEEFYISSPFGGRPTNDDELRVMVKPVRYLGTAKEDDEYYEDYAYLEKNGETGDGFGTVYLKESAEKFFKPKLEELFGKNVLVAVYPDGHYEKIDFEEEMTRRKALYKEDPEGEYYPLTGGIYIFGRVENEKDREKYRKGIYEFIQYLKQEGMFEYVDLTIYVMDERYLSKEFDELGLQDKLLDNYHEYSKNENPTKQEVIDYTNRQRKIYSEIGENYTINPDKINEIPRDYVIKHNENLFSGILYLSRIVSEKSIKTNYFLKDKKIKQYDKLEDVEL